MAQTNKSIEKLRKIIKEVRKKEPFFRRAELERNIKQKTALAKMEKRRAFADGKADSSELTDKEKIAIDKECFAEQWNKAGWRMALAAFGLTAFIGLGTKAIAGTITNRPQEPTTTIETIQETDAVVQEPSKEDEFRETLQVPGDDTKETKPAETKEKTAKERASEADSVISDILYAYYKKYGTYVNLENVKVLETNATYLAKSAEGDLILDHQERWPVAEREVYSGKTVKVMTLINGTTNEIIYSVAQKDGEYPDVNTRWVQSGSGKEFLTNREQGDYLRASEIDFGKKIQGEKTPGQLAFEAISNRLDRILKKGDYRNER